MIFMVDVNKELAQAILKELPDDYVENPLETYQQYHQRQLFKLTDSLNQIEDDFVAGLELIYEKLESVDLGDEEKPQLPILEEIGLMFEAKSHQVEEKGENLSIRLQDYAEISSKGMANLFMAATPLLDEKDQERAPKAFHALTMLNPAVAIFWLN